LCVEAGGKPQLITGVNVADEVTESSLVVCPRRRNFRHNWFHTKVS